jgi:hypothetical protein
VITSSLLPLNQTSQPGDEDDGGLYALKCALLTLEAALPLGCLYDVPDASRQNIKLQRAEMGKWIRRVELAESATELMEMLLLLEYSIDSKWRLLPFRDTYLAAMPSWAHAVKYATPQSVALRLWALDRLLDYDRVEADTDFQSRKNSKTQPHRFRRVGGGHGFSEFGALPDAWGYGGGGVGQPLFPPPKAAPAVRVVVPAIALAAAAEAESGADGTGGGAGATPGAGAGGGASSAGKKRLSDGGPLPYKGKKRGRKPKGWVPPPAES